VCAIDDAAECALHLTSGGRVTTFAASARPTAVAFSETGEMIAVCAVPEAGGLPAAGLPAAQVQIWTHGLTPRLCATLAGAVDPACALAWSGNDTFLAAASAGRNECLVWHMTSGPGIGVLRQRRRRAAPPANVAAEPFPVCSLPASPAFRFAHAFFVLGGASLLTVATSAAGNGTQLTLWNRGLASDAHARCNAAWTPSASRVVLQGQACTAAAANFTSSTLALGTATGTVATFHMATLALAAVEENHCPLAVTAVAFAADRPELYSTSLDGSVRTLFLGASRLDAALRRKKRQAAAFRAWFWGGGPRVLLLLLCACFCVCLAAGRSLR
jgi:hypothetical protein